jgi:hypothetical protein
VADYDNWFIPEDVTNLRRFLCAGYMHNSSYLGGVVAILVAWTFHLIVRLRTKSPPIPPLLAKSIPATIS